MLIKNYTTKVDVYQSLGEIQGALAKNGARKIMIDYDEIGTKLEAGNEEFISHNLDYRPVCGIKILRG